MKNRRGYLHPDMIVPKTSALIKNRLPRVLSDIVIKYFLTEDRRWTPILRHGEYETCLDIPGRLLRNGLYEACREGYDDIINLMISKQSMGKFNYDSGLQGACRGGQMRIAKNMILRGADLWNCSLVSACEGGHRELVELIISRGATNFSAGLAMACRYGHREIAEYMILLGGNDWNWALECACEGGYRELADLMISHGATDFHRGLHGACLNKNRELMMYMICRDAVMCSYCTEIVAELTI